MPPVLVGPFDGVGVLGAGTAFPELELDNAQALRCLPREAFRGRDVDEDELAFLAAGAREQMGVEKRRWAHPVGTPLEPSKELSSFDLGLVAAQAALADARLGADALHVVGCVTSTPHRMTSTVSAPLGAALGARAACMDVRTGCASGLFALGSLAGLGTFPALLVGAETFSKVIPPVSKAAALSLGDGSGALVWGRKSGARLESLFLETDGRLAGLVTTDGALPPTQSELERGGYLLTGDAEALKASVLPRYVDAIANALAHAKLKAGDIDLFVPHQTGVPMIHAICTKSELPLEKTFVNVPVHSNVGAAGWLVALAEAKAQGRLRDGMRVLVAAVGGGMSWGAAVLRW